MTRREMCPIEFTISLLNGKWKVTILRELSQNPVRFGDLKRLVKGVTPKVLTEQLRELEEDGIVAREIFPEIPPKVEYSLTEKGFSVFTLFNALRDWGLNTGTEVEVICKMCGKCVPKIEEHSKNL